jgi:hypothetical protein
VDLFLSSAKNNGGVDVWFVLLEKPELNSEVRAAIHEYFLRAAIYECFVPAMNIFLRDPIYECFVRAAIHEYFLRAVISKIFSAISYS